MQSNRYDPYKAAEPLVEKLIMHLVEKHDLEGLELTDQEWGVLVVNMGLLISTGGGGIPIDDDMIRAIAYKSSKTKPLRDKYHYQLLRKWLNNIELALTRG
jgi:hypothetical protein